MRGLRGRVWMLRRFGLRRLWRYERARRNGLIIDYSRVLTPNELAVLAEHFTPAPWERP